MMKKGEFSRRSFMGGTAALAAASVLPDLAHAAKPNSKFNGVQIGLYTGCFVKMTGGATSWDIRLLVESADGNRRESRMAMALPTPPEQQQQEATGE